MNNPSPQLPSPHALNQAAVIVGCALVLLAVAFLWGRGCAPSPQPVEPLGIDAGPGEAVIAGTLDAATQAAQARLAELDREHAASIATFNEAQRRKYEDVQAQGPEAVVSWMNDFLKTRDAGT